MKVSLVVPIYNESQHLEIFLKELDALEFAVDKELIFVVLKNINLESDRFGFEPEITAKIARLKVRVVEVPISYFPRSYMEGKKITWKDGLAAVRHILYFNLVQSESKFFKPDMPKKYIPQGRQLL